MLGRGRRRASAHRQAGQEVVHRPVARDGADGPTLCREHPRPGGRHHRHTVVTPEPERHEGDLGHGGTLPTVAAHHRCRAARAGGGVAGRTRRVASACRTRRPTRGSGCGTAASTPSCGPTSVTSGRSSGAPQRAVGAGRRRLRAPPALRRRARSPTRRSGGGRRRRPSPSRPCTGTPSPSSPASGWRPTTSWCERAQRGVEFLLRRRRRSPGGLVELCHPWESGCDDSPRWDDTMPGGRTPAAWFALEGRRWSRSIERSPSGAPLHNPAFAVGSVGFSALVAWNALEVASVTGDERLVTECAGAGRRGRRPLGPRPA